MKNQNLFYQESKRTNPLNLSVSYLSLILLSLVLGYIYTVFIVIIPIIYLNFLLTIGFGLILGIANRLLVRITHNRNKKSQIIQALISGLLANYFQWTAYIVFAIHGSIPSASEYLQNLHWIVIPQNFFALIAEINSIGMWSIFGVSANGFGLAIIWLIEAFIITLLPIVAIYKTKVYPYAELINKWYPKFTFFADFESISMIGQLVKDLQADPLEAIKAIGKGTGLRHCKIHVFYTKEEEKQYLTFENILVDTKGNTNKTIVLNNFAITNKAAKVILDTFEHKRERTEIL